MAKATVILFKLSGNFYTEEEWEIPVSVPRAVGPGNRTVVGPYDMDYSPDFHRICGGAVLVVTQEPWGYPHLFPSEG
jgi:hypothetical protein